MKNAFLQTLGATVLIWALFALLSVWIDRRNGWYIAAFVVFGILSPIGMFCQEVSNSQKRSKYEQMGIKPGYIPLFRYLGGLDLKPSENADQYCLALVTDTELILCLCNERLSREIREGDFWEDVQGEFARLPLNCIQFIGVQAADQDELHKKRLHDFYKDLALNATVGRIMGFRHKTIHFPAIITIVSGDVTHPTTTRFGVGVGAGGLHNMGVLESLMPETLSHAVHMASTAQEFIEVMDTDPAEVITAKLVAGELLKHVLAARQKARAG